MIEVHINPLLHNVAKWQRAIIWEFFFSFEKKKTYSDFHSRWILVAPNVYLDEVYHCTPNLKKKSDQVVSRQFNLTK